MSAAPSFGMESSAAKVSLGKSVVVKGHLLSGGRTWLSTEKWKEPSRCSSIASRLLPVGESGPTSTRAISRFGVA
jgi:hypothetical protein